MQLRRELRSEQEYKGNSEPTLRHLKISVNFDPAAKKWTQTNSKSFIRSSQVYSIIIILIKTELLYYEKAEFSDPFLSQEMNVWSWPMLIKLLLFCYFYSEQTLRPLPRLDAQTNKQTNKLKTHSLKLQKYFISGLNKIINEYKIG